MWSVINVIAINLLKCFVFYLLRKACCDMAWFISNSFLLMVWGEGVKMPNVLAERLTLTAGLHLGKAQDVLSN